MDLICHAGGRGLGFAPVGLTTITTTTTTAAAAATTTTTTTTTTTDELPQRAP